MIDQNYSELIDTGWDKTDQFKLPLDAGPLYEPRALWEIFSIDTSVEQPVGPQRVLSTPRFWKNGSKHSVTLTHLLLAPVGYLLREVEANAPLSLETFDNAMGIINKMQVQIQAPFRQYFTRQAISVPSFSGSPAGEPSMRYGRFLTQAASSGPLGISRWMFPKPYWLPRKGAVRFELSAVPNSRMLNNFPGVLTPYEVAFNEQYPNGGRFRMASRSQQGTVPLTVDGNANVWPTGPNATPLDAFGPSATPSPLQSASAWPAGGAFRGADWKRQETGRGVTRGWLDGFTVHLDQIAYDAILEAQIPLFHPTVTSLRVAPLSLRVGTRCKTTNGGTQEWWWRPGAPLGLVCPTITPAAVHVLDQPITLAQGDSLELEIQSPAPITIPQVGPLSPTYNIGASLCGYASVES